MCELSFADLGKMNRMFFVQQSITNALSNNKEGIGYMQDGSIWKSYLSGHLITNLGTIARDNLSTLPMAFHVRFATNKTLKEDSHSHPFVGENLILMHNGKLEKKDGTILDRDKVDSHCFLDELEAAIKEDPKIAMTDLLPKVMEDWYGKFAFIIYDTRDSQYYVIRGTKAELHMSTIAGRLVVNTKKDDLVQGMHLMDQLNQTIYGKALELGDVTELEKDTIYLFDSKASALANIGEVKENKAPLTSSVPAAWQRATGYVPAAATQARRNEEPMFKRFKKWLDFHGVSLQELNEISYVIMGVSIFELNDDDIRAFYMEVLKVLSDTMSVAGLDIWKQIVKQGKSRFAYEQPDFKFPWMVNDLESISTMLELVEDTIAAEKVARDERLAKL